MSLARTGSRLGVAALLVLAAGNSLQNAVAEGDTRTLSFHHVHTGEDLTITFKRDGRYVPSALQKLDWFMRDWRKAKETNMDPRLFDLLWQVYRESGASKPIEVICGYRSPGTNAMLRRRSSGVANHSQHVLGKAMDFFIPDVPLAKLRALGLHLERGGVGFYPTSGSPFVHMDVGLVRHWPTIPRQLLVKIFPNGRTVHIPADGKPLRNYAAALADVERRGNAPNQRSLDAAQAAGVISDGQVREAELIAARGHAPHTLLASLSGNSQTSAGDSYDGANAMMSPMATQQVGETMQVASAATPAPIEAAPVALKQVAHKHRRVPLPTARPGAVLTAAAKSKPASQLMQTASLTEPAEIRDAWGGLITAGATAPAERSPFEVATADAPETTGSAERAALAYAPESDPVPVARVRPMGKRLPRLPREAAVIPTDRNTTVAVKPPLALGGQRSDSPWLRAAILTPNVTNYLTTNRVGHVDPKWQVSLLRKPEQAVLMSFSADPHLGMVTNRFTGHAVVFLATATFTPPTTVSMR